MSSKHITAEERGRFYDFPKDISLEIKLHWSVIIKKDKCFSLKNCMYIFFCLLAVFRTFLS